MDLTAAFDTVDHDLLLHLERQFGLHGVALLWFRLYLSDKSFRFFSAAVLRLCLVLWLRRPSVSMGISPVFVRHVFFLAPPIKKSPLFLGHRIDEGIGPRLCHITSGLLQLGPDLCTEDDHGSVAAGSECCSAVDLQHWQV